MKKIIFEETFRSAFPQPTRRAAERVLNSIREAHPSYCGWVELDAYIESTPKGYVAVRKHVKYER